MQVLHTKNKIPIYIYTATTCSRNSNAGMLDIAMLSVLAGLGAGGLFPNNCNRDIMRLLRQTVVHFQLSYFTIPLKVTVKLTAGAVMQAIILPHVLFSTLYHHYPSTWRKRICPSSEVLVEFWQAAENHPQMKDHPLLSQENYQEKTIPLAMHGDGTPATGIGKVWAKMMTILSLTSLVGYGSTLEKYFWLYSVFDRLCVQGESGTWFTVFTILAWSFTWLLKGRWPDRDHEGNKFLMMRLMRVIYVFVLYCVWIIFFFGNRMHEFIFILENCQSKVQERL
jgi:hypothetical protein